MILKSGNASGRDLCEAVFVNCRDRQGTIMNWLVTGAPEKDKKGKEKDNQHKPKKVMAVT